MAEAITAVTSWYFDGWFQTLRFSIFSNTSQLLQHMIEQEAWTGHSLWQTDQVVVILSRQTIMA